MSDILNESVVEEITEEIEEMGEIVTRLHPTTVISIVTYGDYEVHDIQQNSSWSKNPYGNSYASVPDDMVESIKGTHGFCDLVLNEDGTEVVSFTAREIPDIPEPEPQPIPENEDIWAELDRAYEEGVNSI